MSKRLSSKNFLSSSEQNVIRNTCFIIYSKNYICTQFMNKIVNKILRTKTFFKPSIKPPTTTCRFSNENIFTIRITITHRQSREETIFSKKPRFYILIHYKESRLKINLMITHETPTGLLNEGPPSNWKSYIWSLAQLTFLSVDLYLSNMADNINSSIDNEIRGESLFPYF